MSKSAISAVLHKLRVNRTQPYFLRFGTQDQILLAKRLGMMLRSGMPILESMHMLGSGARSKSAKYIFQSIATDLSNGQLLSMALARFPKIFNTLYSNMVKVGEASGTLHESLEYIAEELRKKQSLWRKVVSALVYPAIIVSATIGITMLLTVFIFPKIIPIFQSIKASLPFSTRLLIATSHFLNQRGLLLLALCIFLSIIFFVLMRLSSRFHTWVDLCLLRLPLLGSLSRHYTLANSSRTLGLLLKSDVGVVTALEFVALGTRNHAYKHAFSAAIVQVTQGKKISEQFVDSPHLFPPLMTQMIAVGETTGNLSSSCLFLSELYEEELNELTKNLTTMLEPVLMIVMGLVVGFIAISIITPIYSLTQSLAPK